MFVRHFDLDHRLTEFFAYTLWFRCRLRFLHFSSLLLLVFFVIFLYHATDCLYLPHIFVALMCVCAAAPYT